MIDMGPTANSPRGYRISAATIAAVASVLGIMVYIGGFVSGYMLMRQSLTDLQAKVDIMQSKVDEMADRLTHVEADAHYTAQGIADLKALKAGTNR